MTFNEQGNVITGRWYDPYTDQYFTNPSDLDIDHFVPLKNAHDSGGASWNSSKKEDYANDLDDLNHLIAVSKSANRSKGSKSPAEWLPPNKAYWCDYVTIWISIKEKWGLSIDDEVHEVNNKLCLE